MRFYYVGKRREDGSPPPPEEALDGAIFPSKRSAFIQLSCHCAFASASQKRDWIVVGTALGDLREEKEEE